jgi:hypothetical protein
MLTSALLFALLAIVATAIGACVGIARDLMLDEPDETDETTDGELIPSGKGQVGLAEDFGLGLRHAGNFARDPGSVRSSGSLNA